MKKVLILGAGTYQIPLIQRASEKGFHVSVASWRADDPGMVFADDAWVVDTTDRETLLSMAVDKRIQGVTTTGTDVAVPSIGYICDHLGLPGISFDTALCATDKVRMQQAFVRGSVPSAVHVSVTSEAEAIDAAQQIGFPVVIKAPDSSGSRGVTVVKEAAEISSAFMAAMQVSRNGWILVEALLTGVEFGAQVIVVDGQVIACLCHNDTVTPPPISVPIGHSCPCALPEAVLEEAAKVCCKAVNAIGIRTGICNADLIYTETGVFILEIGARIGATGIPEIIQMHYGVNLYDIALDMATGTIPKINICPGPSSAVLIIRSNRDGMLEQCLLPEDVRNMEGVVSVGFDYAEGATVRRFQTGPDRIGDIFTTGTTAESAEKLCEWVHDELDIQVMIKS